MNKLNLKKNDELATKSDIKDVRIEIKELEMRLIKWQIGIAAVSITSIFTLLKFFH